MVQVGLLCNKGSSATMFNGHTCHCFPNPSHSLWLLTRFWEFHHGFLPFPFGGCIMDFISLPLLLCRQKKLVYVLRKYIGFVFTSKVAWRHVEHWNWEWNLHLLWIWNNDIEEKKHEIYCQNKNIQELLKKQVAEHKV